MSVVAVIPARGGSKGIPNKNLVSLCGKPLIAWSIVQAKAAKSIDSVWVTSDSDEILKVAKSLGAHAIRRPPELATDTASSESAWLHALDEIEKDVGNVELVVGMQATSPIREPKDLDGGVDALRRNGFDSLLSCCEIEDFFMWKRNADGTGEALNYDPANRKRRQNIEKRFLENGSFYVFKPEALRSRKNRLSGRIGLFPMDRHKMFQIDRVDEVRLCEAVMKGFGYDREFQLLKGGSGS